MAMFNGKHEPKLMEKFKLDCIVKQYGKNDFSLAMDELREEICGRMRISAIKSHLIGRKIQKKERVVAYITFFIQEELQRASISYRLNYESARRIEELMNQVREENDFIDSCLSSGSEVFERFASLNNVIF